MFTDNSGANRHAVRTGTKCPHPTSTPLLNGVRPESRAGIFYCYYCFQLGERERVRERVIDLLELVCSMTCKAELISGDPWGKPVWTVPLWLCIYVFILHFISLLWISRNMLPAYRIALFFVKYLNLWLAPRLTDSLIFFLKQWNRNSKLWSLLISFDRKINSSANHYHCLFNSCAVYRAL